MLNDLFSHKIHASEDIGYGYRVCPLRLILRIFEAKAHLQARLQDDISVTPEEIYTLVNCEDLRSNPSPTFEEVTEVLERYYNQEFQIVRGENRFAFLEATGLFAVDRGNNIRLYPYGDYNLNYNRNIQIEAVCWLREDKSRFDCFDECQPILEPLIVC